MVNVFDFADNELMSLIKEGNRQAYEEIFRRYNRELFLLAYKKLRDQEEARDIVQEVFANLWIKKESIPTDIKNIGAYFYIVLRNRIFDLLAKKKHASKYIQVTSLISEAEEVKADHLIRSKQLNDRIEREIAALPTRMRLVFELSRKEHFSHKEIAQQLHISHQTVTDQIKKALKILRSRLVIAAFLYFLIK